MPPLSISPAAPASALRAPRAISERCRSLPFLAALLAFAGSPLSLLAQQDRSQDSQERPDPDQTNPDRPAADTRGALITPDQAREQGRRAVPTPRVGEVVRRDKDGNIIDPSSPDTQPDENALLEALAQSNEPQLAEDEIRFDFRDAVEVSVLLRYATEELGVQIVASDPAIAGQQVYLTAPVVIKRRDVLPFLNMLLDSKGFTISADVGGYIVRKTREVSSGPFDADFGTTRVIPTPGMRPSSLSEAVQTVLQGGTSTDGAVSGQEGQPGFRNPRIAYVDDLGVIIMTDSVRRTQAVVDLVNRLVEERSRVLIHRLALRYIAADVARSRVLELVGDPDTSSSPFGSFNQNRRRRNDEQNQGVGLVTGGETLSHLTDRLTIDPQGNALLFRGRADELDLVRQVVAVVDTLNELRAQWYPVGSAAAETIAQEGKRLGLGQVISVRNRAREEMLSGGSGGGDFFNNSGSGFAFDENGNPIPNQGANQEAQGGPVFIVDPTSGGFLYYGTPEQHAKVSQLAEELRDLTRSVNVVYEFYKLKNTKARSVAAIIQGLINNTTPAADNPLLGDQQGNTPAFNAFGGQNRSGSISFFDPNSGFVSDSGEIGGINPNENVFVLGDETNNQVIVKARPELQPQFAKIIERLDLRRPQVYLDAKIVAVTGDDSVRLAFETQILAGEFAMNTNFGLGSIPGQFQTKKNVGVSLSGITAALIKSDYVPIIINAVANNTNARIVSSPQLLVDDNVEATIKSADLQPTTSSSQGTSTTQTSFNGYEEAGTELIITPQISEGGHLNLKYEVNLSSFTGSERIVGDTVIPSPKQENTLTSESVTIPSDATIVVGGLQFESVSRTISKIPLLGDIPFVGQLFRDEQYRKRTTTLYVFITPTIMRDKEFDDLRLLTRGPLKASELPDPYPQQTPVRMELVASAAPSSAAQPPSSSPPPADLQPPPSAPEPMRLDPPPASDPPPMQPSDPAEQLDDSLYFPEPESVHASSSAMPTSSPSTKRSSRPIAPAPKKPARRVATKDTRPAPARRP